MPVALAIALPLILAAVLLASAVAKIRRPDDLSSWADLGVPAVVRRAWLLRLHPWGELGLCLALALLGGALGLVAALAAVALMSAYLLLVVRVLARPDDASCACFGARKAVTTVTVVRNGWLTVLAVATAAVIWTNPLWGGAAAAAADVAGWGWILALGVAAVTTALILWPVAGQDPGDEAAPAPVAHAQAAEDDLDYIRTRTPAVPVTLADGTTANLRSLTRQQPTLLLALSETCGSCTTVHENEGAWRELLPEVDIRLLLSSMPSSSTWAEVAEPQSLHDPEGYVRESIGEWATPTAVLLGVDGMLAGGPVTGSDAIADFVADIRSALDESATTVTYP